MEFRQRILNWLLKSFYDQHPELINREHLWRIWSDEETQKPSTFSEFSSDYNITTWVHTAVKKWQDAFSFLPLRVSQKAGQKYEFVDHPLNTLLENPNPTRSSSDIWRQWACDMALGGEEGFEFVRSRRNEIIEIWPHQPIDFHVIPDKSRLIYYAVAGYTVERAGVAKYDLDAGDFLHTKFYNPGNPWRGISPMSAIRMSVSIEQLSSAWTKMFFTNGARPDGVLITPQGLTAKERQEVENKFQERVGITGKGVNWHKVIALEKGIMDYKPVNFTQRDMQWVESRKLTRNEIGGIFGVPDELMGFGKDTYENFERALLTFWSETMTPLIKFRDDQLTFFMRREGLLQQNQSIQTDTTQIYVLSRLQNARYQLAMWLSQMGVPFNIINAYLQLGLPEFKAGDISIPFGTSINFDEEGKPTELEAAETTEKILKILSKRNGVSIL